MSKIIVNDVESLYRECAGHVIDIYGAKTVAQRTCHFLESEGLRVNTFVVSNRYKNPQQIRNKPVNRIEDGNKTYDCMVLAVSGKFVRDVEKELEKYDICKLVIINPLMDDDFPINSIISEVCNISERAFLSTKAQVFADDSSSIIIDDNVVVKDGVTIFATSNSKIHIKKGTFIGENTAISAQGNSEIEILEYSRLDEKNILRACEDSMIFCGRKFSLGYRSTFCATRKSMINMGDEVTIGMFSQVGADRDSKIRFNGNNDISQNSCIYSCGGATVSVGKGTTFYSNLYMGAESSVIQIGDDNMFSYYVKMNTGSHKVLDRKSGKDITNRNYIRTGNHVWVGMGATLLPGCDVANNSIVGASAVVTKFIEPHSACAGNPAVVIKRDIDWDRNLPQELDDM